MTNMKQPSPYSFEDYDKYNCLTPGPNLWVIMLFLAHSFIIIAIQLATTFKGRGKGGPSPFMDYLSPISVIGAILAILVIWAFFNKHPDKHGIVKTIWKNGKTILLVSALLGTAEHLLEVIQSYRFALTPVLFSIAYGFSLIYLLMSRRVRDVFSEYPEHLPETGK